MTKRAGGEQVDVVVIGGGPSGCSAAITSAGLGLRTMLVEREHTPKGRVGESLHPGAEAIFRTLGMIDRIDAAGFLRHRGHWTEDVRTDARTFVPFGSDASGDWRGYQAWRPTLDAMLQQRAEEAGVDVRRGVSARDVRRHRGRRVTGIDTSAGAVRAAMLVDGAGDTHWLARRLGIARQAASPPLVASYGYVRGPRGKKYADPRFTIDHIGWTWIAAVRPGVLQWTRLATDGRRVGDRPATLDACEPIGRDRGADVTWRIASDLAGPGWLIAGDGAWVLDPSSSHGVLKALMSGMFAAHTAATAIATPEHATAASERYTAWLRRWFDSDRAELSRRGAPTAPAIAASPVASHASPPFTAL